MQTARRIAGLEITRPLSPFDMRQAETVLARFPGPRSVGSIAGILSVYRVQDIESVRWLGKAISRCSKQLLPSRL
jgi:hypothetical protein